jgi:hypothetical protein
MHINDETGLWSSHVLKPCLAERFTKRSVSFVGIRSVAWETWQVWPVERLAGVSG